MKRSTILLGICLFLVTGFLQAQSWDVIKDDPEWLKGYGYGNTREEADKAAIADLISKISIQVYHEFEQREDEKTSDGSIDAHSSIKNKLNPQGRRNPNL